MRATEIVKVQEDEVTNVFKRASTQENLEEAPSIAQDDEMAHQDSNGVDDNEYEEMKMTMMMSMPLQ